MTMDPSAQAGPSGNHEPGPEDSATIEIPSSGLEYWEYRRAAFLAGKPFPAPRSPSTELPKSYTVPPPPPPAPSVMYQPARGSSIERLEALLSTFGAEESEVAWNGGVGGVAKNLGGGKRLAKGLRLGLVIKILRAGWLRDGTWPLDPKTLRALPPPDSPPPAPGPDPYAPRPSGPAVATYTPQSHVFQLQRLKHSQQRWQAREKNGTKLTADCGPFTSSAVLGISGVSAPGLLELPSTPALGASALLGNSPMPSPHGLLHADVERQLLPIPTRAGNE